MHLHSSPEDEETVSPGVPWPASLAYLMSSRPVRYSVIQTAKDKQLGWCLKLSSDFHVHTHKCVYIPVYVHTPTQRVGWGESIEGRSLLFTFMMGMLRSLSEGIITGQQLHLCFPNCINNLCESRVPKSTTKSFNYFSKPFLPPCLPFSFHCTAFLKVHLSSS